MGKLQKRPPPAYPGLSHGPSTLEDGVRYESLPQDTTQPVPLSPSAHQAAIFGALATPISPTPQTIDSAFRSNGRRAMSAQIDSPVSPLVDARAGTRSSLSASQIHAPQPVQQAADTRKSVELRRLDGKPYPTEQGRKVVVARDMHEGALPPAYKRQNSDPINPTNTMPVSAAGPAGPAHGCQTCGKNRISSTGSTERPHSCNKCGKRKTVVPSYPPSAVPAHVRSISETSTAVSRSAPSPIPSGPSIAGPSTETPVRKCCTKCGKYKKPVITPIQQGPSIPPSPHARGLSPAPLVSANFSRPQQPALSLIPASNGPLNPEIDIIPPTASSYRPTHSSFSTYGDDTPLVPKSAKTEFKMFSNSSLRRSLSRRLSKKEKNKDTGAEVAAPLPSQQLGNVENQTGEQSAGRLINMISNAIRDPSNEKKEPQYSMLATEEPIDRPASPFSFVENAKEDEAFEMVALNDEKKSDSGSLRQVADAEGEGLQTLSMRSPVIIEETVDSDEDQISKQPAADAPKQDCLVVPSTEGEEQHTTISRFKSLRGGVSRAKSLSRGTSLRRLESLKSVHRNWYRDDMSLEGANSESVPVF